MIVGILVVLALAAEPDCRPAVDPPDGGVATLELDLDGDGAPDTVRVRRHDFAEVVFTAKGKKPQQVSLLMEGYAPFEVVFDVLELPRTDAREGALRFIEEHAFELTCDEADPSLQRLWQQQTTGRGRRMPLRWVEGPPVPPRWYTVRRGAHWVTYRGNFHGRMGVESPWISEVTRGAQVLVATQHGLVLIDNSAAPRHAWLYVSDFGFGKLRHATISNPRFEGGLAIADFTSPLSDDWSHTTRIEVSLETGAVRVVTSKR